MPSSTRILLGTGLAVLALAGCTVTRGDAPLTSTGTATVPAVTSPVTGRSATVTPQESVIIEIKLLQYHPAALTVAVGTTVTWRNGEPISHTVTSGTVSGVNATTGLRSDQQPDGVFSAVLAHQGDTFSYTFTKAGTYGYYCDIHQGMYAQIIVN